MNTSLKKSMERYDEKINQPKYMLLICLQSARL